MNQNLPEELDLDSYNLTFADLVGDLEVFDSLVLLPKNEGLTGLKSLKEAKERLEILSKTVMNGNSILTHGSIFKREYEDIKTFLSRKTSKQNMSLSEIAKMEMQEDIDE